MASGKGRFADVRAALCGLDKHEENRRKVCSPVRYTGLNKGLRWLVIGGLIRTREEE